ncbi:uncharacterized protein LOC130010312 [Patella vulgata]|uniref:uncharacterized protein LOC130010312 n=1 Tax=Patella vulgata TaxID=6465 RepID=UPI00218026A2|nr:uncharacterized protein LOC130010312 [Patella vulgata]
MDKSKDPDRNRCVKNNNINVKTTDTVITCYSNGVKTVSNILNDQVYTNGDYKEIKIQDERDSCKKEEEEPRKKRDSEVGRFVELLKKKRIQKKLVYVISLTTIVILVHGLFSVQWLLPYYYTITTPILLLIRIIIYWGYKWQYFLIDFCYYGNIMWYSFIWMAPHQAELFMVVFAFANGPMVWAMVLFRNSLVLHCIDKTTSVYIHLLPALLSFVIRWYPRKCSIYWYSEFLPVILEWSMLWIIIIPVACSLLHSMLYIIVISIMKPSDEYLTSYRYLTAKTTKLVFKSVNIFGPRWRLLIYNIFNWLFCLICVTMTIIWYNYFIAHSVFLGAMFLIVSYNGASFYMDVFSVRAEIFK